MQARQLHKIHQHEKRNESWYDYFEARLFKKTVIKKTKRRKYWEPRKKIC